MSAGKRILIYYPHNNNSVLFEVLCEQLLKRGHEVFFLSLSPPGPLHAQLERRGVKMFSHVVPKTNASAYYLRQIVYLARFCDRHRIDYVYSNLQHANFISVFAQFLMKTKVVAFRHHFKFSVYLKDPSLKVDRNEALFDTVINRLARKIVVFSSGVYDGMKNFERVDLGKVEIIPPMYDFSKYGKPDLENAKKIRKAHSCKLLLIMVSRMVPFKRHALVFPVVKKLVDEGLDLKMVVLDEGVEKPNLERYIAENRLKDRISLVGYRRDFLDYMAASDLLVHPSLTEATNSVTKEMGLLEKAVAVCAGVGDFSDYIVDGENGYLLPMERTEVALEALLRRLYADRRLIETPGRRLREDVLAKFSVRDEVVDKYVALLES